MNSSKLKDNSGIVRKAKGIIERGKMKMERT